MGKLKHFNYRHWPIAVKLMVSYGLLIVTLLSLLAYITYAIFWRTTIEQLNGLVYQQIEQLNKHMDNYVDSMVATSQTILAEPYYPLLVAGLKPDDNRRTIESSIRIDDALDFVRTVRTNQLLGVALYTPGGDAYLKTASGGYWIEHNYEQLPWYNDLDARAFTLTVLGTIEQSYFNNSAYSFSILQPIRLTGSRELLGVLQVFGSLEHIHQMMKGIQFSEQSALFVLDQTEKVVYSTEQGALGTRWGERYELNLAQAGFSDQSLTQLELAGERYAVGMHTSSITGWKIIYTIPFDDVTAQAGWIRTLFLQIGAVAVLLACLFSVLIALGFTRPLRLLTRHVALLEKHNYLLPPMAPRFDEIGRLVLSVKQMSNRIRYLINEVYMSQLSKQEAEIRELQSKMNPHFLFNTLESIRMTLLKGDADAAEQGIVSLGQILRYKASEIPDLVPVRQEVALIQSLLTIYQIRCGDQLTVHFQANEAVLDAVIPSLIIQPLVENAIQYGLSPEDDAIRIHVSIEGRAGKLCIEVSDEGAGMQSEQLMALVDYIKLSTEREGGSVGLRNVYKRLRMRYGEQADLTIESMPGVGTQVSIVVPLVIREREANA